MIGILGLTGLKKYMGVNSAGVDSTCFRFVDVFGATPPPAAAASAFGGPLVLVF